MPPVCVQPLASQWRAPLGQPAGLLCRRGGCLRRARRFSVRPGKLAVTRIMKRRRFQVDYVVAKFGPFGRTRNPCCCGASNGAPSQLARLWCGLGVATRCKGLCTYRLGFFLRPPSTRGSSSGHHLVPCCSGVRWGCAFHQLRFFCAGVHLPGLGMLVVVSTKRQLKGAEELAF